MLRPQENATRELKSLVGLWRFSTDPEGVGRDQQWYAGALARAIDMPVPASYNEITADQALYNYVGEVWYQTTTYVPRGWAGRRVVLRFGSATHAATVWVNDTEVMRHKGGYLPFEADVTALVRPGEQLRITAAVDNRLDWTTIPPGWFDRTPNGTRQKYFQDFFNYAGLHRPVHLYATGTSYVDDVTIRTDYDGRTGLVDYEVVVAGEGVAEESAVAVTVLDANGTEVAAADGAAGRVEIPEVTLWQPGAGYQYDLLVTVRQGGEVVDQYAQKFGVRTVRVAGSKFLINDVPFYFRGFGMHEDHHVFGKGQHDASMVHDFNLLAWIGANSYRTSHYPYSEENMDYADSHGIVVIDETPAVGLNLGITGGIFQASAEGESVTFRPDRIGDAGQAQHAQEIRELISRDKNRPSVVLWSIANEPESETQGAQDYFRPLFDVAREADPTRPVGFVNVMLAPAGKCKVTELADVVMINRYYGWYVNSGDIPNAMHDLRAEIRRWIELEDKPIIFTEFGADTMAGQHGLMGTMWTEEYQHDLMEATLRVFDEFPQVAGEHMWNFADFQTSAGIMRLDGNKKGAFTRDRRPKAVAHLLRKRWTSLPGHTKPSH